MQIAKKYQKASKYMQLQADFAKRPPSLGPIKRLSIATCQVSAQRIPSRTREAIASNLSNSSGQCCLERIPGSKFSHRNQPHSAHSAHSCRQPQRAFLTQLFLGACCHFHIQPLSTSKHYSTQKRAAVRLESDQTDLALAEIWGSKPEDI